MGRRAERAALEKLLAQSWTGQSGVVVVCGEAGIGKTALLLHAQDVAVRTGFRVEALCGIESECEFAFGGLHQLCRSLMDGIDVLPEVQRMHLQVALGLRTGVTPDRFLVALAALNLLAEAAERVPLLCLVDDAQWLDEASAQVLAFVARRLAAERVAFVLGRRDLDLDLDESDPFSRLPELRVGGLADEEARELLAGTGHAPLDERVRDRLLAEARGNPLALLELPRHTPPTLLAGGYQLPSARGIPRRIEESFRRRSASLPEQTQRLLLVAATDPTGDTALVWRAARRLGIDEHAASPAESSGLLEIDARVRFRHPLVRSAIYHAATSEDRRLVHAALASATDAHTDPDRRIWHRAQAVLGTDDAVAADLEHSAARARSRGGLAATAAFLQRATELTSDPGTRSRRALDAARAKNDAGALDEARELLKVAAAGPLGERSRADLELERAKIAFRSTRGREAPAMLLEAAQMLVPLDPPAARETYLGALEASFHTGRLGGGLLKAAEAARAAPVSASPPRPSDLLLDGLAARYTQGYEASVPALQQAMVKLREEPLPDEDDRWLWLACQVAAMLWDDESIYALAHRAVAKGRESGALASLPASLTALSSVLVLTGDLGRAEELVAEETAITKAIDAPPLPNARLILASWSGRREETLRLHQSIVEEATARGEGATLGLAEIALSTLHNALGNYDDALAAATPPVDLDELTFSSIALPELIEAAVRAGRPDQAGAALDVLAPRARASGTEWALGILARARALLDATQETEELFRESIDRLGRTRVVSHLARTHLVYGEWLRRSGRRQDAREQLRTAHDLLTDMGAEAFAARAARELGATGERPRSRSARPTDALTAQELHVARLVATGATSREVGAQLFLSPRTIEAHLRSIFRKLGITSRRQLRDLGLADPSRRR